MPCKRLSGTPPGSRPVKEKPHAFSLPRKAGRAPGRCRCWRWLIACLGALFRKPDREKGQAYGEARFLSDGVTYLSLPFVLEVRRAEAGCYRPRGAYLQGGFLLKGSCFDYDEWDALPLTPKEGGEKTFGVLQARLQVRF